MFIRSFASKDRAGKSKKTPKNSYIVKDPIKTKALERSLGKGEISIAPSLLTKDHVKFIVGKDKRLFASHIDCLQQSTWMQHALKCHQYAGKSISHDFVEIADEEPAVFALILEYLYKGDYTPRLIKDKRNSLWGIEGNSPLIGSQSPHSPSVFNVEPTMFLPSIGNTVLRDTVVYCAAERYGLPELKRLALRKQKLQEGADTASIVRSMRYAYANTPSNDGALRGHYLELIWRKRRTFMHSGTMQQEMTRGGSMWFDLFVAVCAHYEDTASSRLSSPRTI